MRTNALYYKGLRKVDKYFRNTYLPILFKRKNLDPENAILIFGEARGGTTWLAETLNRISGAAISYEPLAVNKDPLLKKMKFHWRQYIPEDVTYPEARLFFEKIFNGTAFNYSRSRLNSMKELKNADKIVVKFIRANGMLPWLVRQFNFKYKPVYLIRNPYAVIASQLKFPEWYKPFDEFIIPDCPFNDIYKKHVDFLKTIKTEEEYLAFMWCLINLVPLKHSENNRSWITVNYENLVLAPEKELRRIFRIWNLELDPKILDNINKPSFSSYRDLPLIGKEQLIKWKNNLNEEQTNRIERVLRYFNIEYYNKDPYPNINFYK